MLDFNFIFPSRNSDPKLLTEAYHVSCQTENITIHFYAIINQKSTLHISFDKNRHQHALRCINKQSPVTDHSKNVSLSVQNLHQLLANNTVFPPFSSSPFLSQGTPFQKKVWRLIEKIPFGDTRTYGTLANQLGNSNLARAVGNACNRNPVALLIPCHRVVGKNSLGGFAGGNEIKKQLLELER
jgi:methylated-DNA-[protein]-cysteine S-methyltransferase